MQVTLLNRGQMWVKPEQLDVAICRLHHKNKSIVKKTDGGNVPGNSSGWAGKTLVSKVFGSFYHSSHQAYRTCCCSCCVA